MKILNFHWILVWRLNIINNANNNLLNILNLPSPASPTTKGNLIKATTPKTFWMTGMNTPWKVFYL